MHSNGSAALCMICSQGPTNLHDHGKEKNIMSTRACNLCLFFFLRNAVEVNMLQPTGFP